MDSYEDKSLGIKANCKATFEQTKLELEFTVQGS